MTKWLIYNEAGIFTGTAIDCPAGHLDENVPEGHGCIMGDYDMLSQRVDVETGLVVGYQPPAPSARHEWNADAKRWVYVPTLDENKAARVKTIGTACASELASMTASYPDGEVKSWPKQESEARAHVADPTAPTPLLARIASERRIDLADLAARVIVKADYFASISGALIGRRQRCEDEIDASPDQQALDLIEW